MTDATTSCSLRDGLVDAGLCAIDKLPLPIGIALLIAAPVITWLLYAEWRLLGQPGNPAFLRQIERIRLKVDEASIAKRYHRLLRSLLAGIDRCFGPVATARPDSVIEKWFGCQPLTRISYERLLSFAFFYPVLFMMWGLLLVNSNEHWLLRVLFFPLILLGFFGGFKAGHAAKRLMNRVSRRWFLGLSANIIVAFAITAAILVVALAFIFVIAATVSASVSEIADVNFACVVACLVAVVVGASIGAGVAVVVIIGTGILVFFCSFFFVIFTNPADTVIFYVFFSVIVVVGFTYQKWHHQFAQFWLMFSLLLMVLFGTLSLISANTGMNRLVLYMVFLPIFNVPLDWLSLGVTRGLLSQIERGRHRSVSALGWALIDIALALVFLLAVSFSSFLAYLLAKTISPESVYTLAELRDAIDGGDEMSIGIWLMLASTLIPTFLHFLVALAAFVSLPFTRKRTQETLKQLQTAADEVERRKLYDSNQAAELVPVDAYARRWAMAHFFAYWPLVIGLWALLCWFLSYVIYTVMRNLFLLLL